MGLFYGCLPAYDGGRIIRVGQEVQHGNEQDTCRFVEVDQTPQFRVGSV